MIKAVSISDDLYRRLEVVAQQSHRSVEEVAQHTLAAHLPLPVESELPEPLRTELQAMEQLSEDALWQIAESVMNPDKVAMFDLLLERHKEETLTPAGRSMLDQLRQEADALMLRKAHAYVLLKSRGHRLPTLAELQNQPLSQP